LPGLPNSGGLPGHRRMDRRVSFPGHRRSRSRQQAVRVDRFLSTCPGEYLGEVRCGGVGVGAGAAKGKHSSASRHTAGRGQAWPLEALAAPRQGPSSKAGAPSLLPPFPPRRLRPFRAGRHDGPGRTAHRSRRHPSRVLAAVLAGTRESGRGPVLSSDRESSTGLCPPRPVSRHVRGASTPCRGDARPTPGPSDDS